jgi:hypothetical protein
MHPLPERLHSPGRRSGPTTFSGLPQVSFRDSMRVSAGVGRW